MLRSLVAALATLAVVAVAVSLGNWQLRRAGEKQALQAARDAALAGPAIAVGAAPLDPASVAGARVAARGPIEAARTGFLDHRSHRGVPGLVVIAPMRIGDGPMHVLVLRGWAAHDPADRNRLPEFATPARPVEIEGLAEPNLPQALSLGREHDPAPGERLWLSFSVPKYARWSGLQVQPFVIRQTSALPDGLVREWPQPGPDVSRHYGYAVQWYALALVAVVFWGYARFVRPRKAP